MPENINELKAPVPPDSNQATRWAEISQNLWHSNNRINQSDSSSNNAVSSEIESKGTKADSEKTIQRRRRRRVVPEVVKFDVSVATDTSGAGTYTKQIVSLTGLDGKVEMPTKRFEVKDLESRGKGKGRKIAPKDLTNKRFASREARFAPDRVTEIGKSNWGGPVKIKSMGPGALSKGVGAGLVLSVALSYYIKYRESISDSNTDEPRAKVGSL